MNPLLFTLAFLTLLGILTSSQFVQHGRDCEAQHFLVATLEQHQAQEALTQQALFDDLQHEKVATRLPSTSKPTSTAPREQKKRAPLRYQASRPPNNSRLNFALIVEKQDPFWTEAAAALMRHLYASYPLFQEIPNAEYRILESLVAHQETLATCDSPDTLGTLSFEDPQLQHLFYCMLKGNNMPSLLECITYDPLEGRAQHKLNLLFAPPALLHALFPNICDQLIPLIDELWQEIETSDTITRTSIRQELTHRFETLLETTSLPKAETKKLFDFTLGKPGNILFLQNPATGRIERTPLPHKTTLSNST